MVAHGMSNRRIAQELYLSERTIEKHVSKILRKLDLASRTEIATWATEQRLITPSPPGDRVRMRTVASRDRSAPDVVRVWLLGGFRVSVGERKVDESTLAAQEGGEPREAARPSSCSPPPPRAGHGPLVAGAREEEAAANSLSQALHAARSALEPDRRPGGSRATWLRRASNSCCAQKENCGWTWRPSRRRRRRPRRSRERASLQGGHEPVRWASCYPKTLTRSGRRSPVKGLRQLSA